MGQVDAVYKEFGRRLRSARRRRGITQDALALATGLSRTSITHIEGGRQQVVLHKAVALARGVGETLGTLLPHDDPFTEIEEINRDTEDLVLTETKLLTRK